MQNFFSAELLYLCFINGQNLNLIRTCEDILHNLVVLFATK